MLLAISHLPFATSYPLGSTRVFQPSSKQAPASFSLTVSDPQPLLHLSSHPEAFWQKFWCRLKPKKKCESLNTCDKSLTNGSPQINVPFTILQQRILKCVPQSFPGGLPEEPVSRSSGQLDNASLYWLSILSWVPSAVPHTLPEVTHPNKVLQVSLCYQAFCLS